MLDRTYRLNLDVALLRRQRDWLLDLSDDIDGPPVHRVGEHSIDPTEGLVSLCDELLDQAEGFSLRYPDPARLAAQDDPRGEADR